MNSTDQPRTPRLAVTRLKLLAATLFILILAQCFNAGLSLSSLEKLFLGSMVSRYQVVTNDFLADVGKAMRFGKTLDKFVGIGALMDNLRENLGDSEAILVADPKGRVLYSNNPEFDGQVWPDLAGDKAKLVNLPPDQPAVTQNGERYYVEFPVEKAALGKGKTPTRVGTAIICFPKDNVRQRLDPVVSSNLDMLLLLTLGSALILALFLQFFLHLDPERFSKIRLYLILTLAMGGSMVVYSLQSVDSFRDNYIHVTRDNAAKVARMTRGDVEFLLDKGLGIKRLFKMDVHLAQITKTTPEIQEIGIIGLDGEVLYLADSKGPVDPGGQIRDENDLDPYFDIGVSLFSTSKDGRKIKAGTLLLKLSEETVTSRVRQIVLDSITVSVIGMLFLLELIILFIIYIQKTVLKSETTGSSRYGIIRPVAFLFLFALDMSFSFIPLHMENLYQPLWGLSKDIVLGLPISAEMLMAGFFVILGGLWTDRHGWRAPFFTGLAVAGAGCLWSGMAADMAQFIASRAFIGIGYGLALMATEGFVVDNTGPGNRATGISHLFAGVYAGSLCGSAAGAMLADRLGFPPVFMASAAIMAVVMVAVFLLVRGQTSQAEQPEPKATPKAEPAPKAVPIPKPTPREFIRYLMDRDVFALVFLSIVPGSLILVGFINFLLPLYLNRIGTTQSDIGRVLMVYNVCLIYLAPLLGVLVDKSKSKRSWIFISGIVAAVGMGGYLLQADLVMTIFAALMLGLSSSLAFGAQNAYVLELRVTEKFGHGAAMGVTNAMERIGQVLGPVVLASVVVFLGIETGMAVAGAGFLILSVLFMAMARERTPAGAGTQSQEQA